VFGPPGIPADRLAALRKAFDDTMKDPEFDAELKKLGLTLDPLSGKDLAALVEEVGNMPPDIFKRVKDIYPVN